MVCVHWVFLWITLCHIYRSSRALLKDRSSLVVVKADAAGAISRCVFPENLTIHLTSVLNRRINLTLHLISYKRSSYAPLYSITPSGIARHRDYENNKNSQFYYNEENTANLLLECFRSDDARPFTMFGIILNKDEEYLVRPLQKTNSSLLPVLLESWGDQTVFITLTQLVSHSNIKTETVSPTPVPRYRRAIPQLTPITSFTVEVLAVVDYSVFIAWYTDSRSLAETTSEHKERVKNEIKNYYEHVIKGVDLRYENIQHPEFRIHIMLIGVIIIESFDACPWLNGTTYYTNINGQRDLNADEALKAFKLWINDTEGLPAHDHAVLFTRYDLYTPSGTESSKENKISHTSGLAFIGTLCEPGDSVSIVEEQGGFQSVGTVTHEIGHSLGALHDGENNTCLSENRYIMAASGFGSVPESKIFNPWLFSDCSKEYFKQFVAKTLGDGPSCLLQRSVNTKNPDDVPGQVFSPDEQCKMIWGPKSYLCRGSEFGTAATICTSMYCRDPSTINDCVLHTAARGTSCGNKQWCHRGRCVYSPKAPEKRDSCILGDQPGPAFNGMTCSQLVDNSPSYCYQDKVRARCCESCWTKYTSRKGCEYGDRIQGCRPWHCSMSDTSSNITRDCCATCDIGQMITTTPSFQIEVTTDKFSVEDIGKTGACEDHNISPEYTCSQYTHVHGPHVCYGDIMSRLCCRSCSSLSKSQKDCEYGDRTPDLCTRIANRTSLLCSKYETYCCESCVQEQVLSGTTSNRHVMSYVFTFVCVLILTWMDYG